MNEKDCGKAVPYTRARARVVEGLAAFDAAPSTPPEESLAAHVYRSARAVAAATVVVDEILAKLRLGGVKMGGDPCASKSEGLVADAAGHAIDAELLHQRVRDLADLIGTSH